MINIQTVYDKFLLYKKNLGDVSTELFLDWCDEVNRFAYRILYGQDPNRYLVDYTINVSANTTTYALPTDFLNIEPIGAGVYVNANGLPYPMPLAKSSFGNLNIGYYLTNGNIVFTPIPQNSQVITLRYIPILTTLTSFTDEMVIPDDFIAYVRYALDVLYSQWDEDFSAEGITDARYQRALDELARNLRQDTGTIGIIPFNASGFVGGYGSGYPAWPWY